MTNGPKTTSARDGRFPSSNMSSSSLNQGGGAYSCDDCSWRTVIDGTHSRTDCTQEAIQHHVETAHTVVDRSSDHQPGYSRFRLADGRL